MQRFAVIVLRVLEVAAVVVILLLVRRNAVLQRYVNAAAAREGRELSTGTPMNRVPVVDLQGRSRELDLTKGRYTIVAVDPSCASCDKVLARLGSAPGAYVLSIGAPAAVKPLAEKHALVDHTFVLRPPLPPELDRGFRSFPQIVIVERGTVVRTCLTLAECGA